MIINEHAFTDLFLSPAQTLVNPVNVVGVMGRGLAAEFKAKFPDMFIAYRCACSNGTLKIGELFVWSTTAMKIVCFPTKVHWHDPSRIEWIHAGLAKFVETYASHGITSVAFPRLGCGLGGLSWDDVGPLIHSYLDPLPIRVYVCA